MTDPTHSSTYPGPAFYNCLVNDEGVYCANRYSSSGVVNSIGVHGRDQATQDTMNAVINYVWGGQNPGGASPYLVYSDPAFTPDPKLVAAMDGFVAWEHSKSGGAKHDKKHS